MEPYSDGVTVTFTGNLSQPMPTRGPIGGINRYPIKVPV